MKDSVGNMEIKPPWLNEREIIIKTSCETNPEYGSNPLNRPIEEHIRFAVINLDKPSGPPSHEVVSWVKRMIGLKRAGHGGTLEAHWLGKPQGHWNPTSSS